MKRRRYWKLGLLIAVPLVLFAVVAERNSWRPRTITVNDGTWYLDRVQLSPDGRFLSLTPFDSDPNPPRFFEISTGRVFSFSGLSYNAPRFISKNRFTFGNRIYALNNENDIVSLPQVSEFVGELFDGKTLLLGPEQTNNKGEILVWDSTSRSTPRILSPLPPLPSKGTIRTFKLLADKRTLAIHDYLPKPARLEKEKQSGRSHQQNPSILSFWDIKQQKLIFTIAQRSIPQLSTIGGFCGCRNDKGDLEIWNYHTGQMLNKFRRYLESCGALSPDGTLYAFGSEYRSDINLWDTRSGKVIRTLKGHGTQTMSLDFSPDGHTLVSNNYKTIQIWRIK